LRPGVRAEEPTGDGSVALAAYRQRARAMLEELRAASDKAHALGVLAIKLQALLEDMKSIGADAKILQPLEKLLTEVQPKKRRATPAQLAKITDQLVGKAESI